MHAAAGALVLNRSRYDFDRGVPGAAGAEIEPIAIVGAACRLPGARDVETFWQMLVDGVDAVSEIPDDRWNKAQLYHPERGQRGKAYTFAAGVLGDVSRFDAGFFGISPREAVQMDPQQRLLLELAYEAVEDAGLDLATLAGEPVGVFVGGSSWDYLNLHVGDVSTTDAYSMIGITLSPLANRISYVFDLRGPSFTVDTACSSSLVALHQACEAIRGGQIGMAMVGGVSLLLAPQSFVGFCAASMLSPNGRCHAFDARADGYVRAEGGGMVALKPLGAALAAGDPIRAVIRGTGVNSDGRTTGFSLPNRDAQAALLEQVYGRFALDPADLAYVEAHGTGTPAGDPIEAGALGRVLGQRRSAPLTIGSVKTNIGHLEAGSGMAGLIKAMLVAERGTIPPSLHSDTPNPNIPFDALNLRLAHEAVELGPIEGQRLVGVNSFGFGGTNAHAVLEAPDPVSDRRAMEDAGAALPPLLLSARSDEALYALAAEWQERLAGVAPDEAPALVRGAAVRRSQHARRVAIAGGTIDQMRAGLDTFASIAAPVTAGVAGKVAFIFSGNGSQWAGMATDAIAHSAAFRDALGRVDGALRPWLGWSVADALAEPDAERLRDTEVAQPLLFAVQVALVLALREQGLEPDMCMGHSVGEVAAAWAAGALDLDAAARVIAARSRAQQARHGVGGMAVLGLDAAATTAALAEAPLAGIGLEMAAHNSSQATTIAGPSEALDALATRAEERGWRFTRLDLDYAFHSAAMDPIAPVLATDLAGLAPRAARIPFVSTVSGDVLDGAALDADYWWRNVRAPVLFAEAAAAMIAGGARLFVEIGPHAVVRAYLSDALRAADKDGRVLPSLSRRPSRQDPVAGLAARAYAAGADIRGAAAFLGEAAVRALPRYPWQRERFWLEATPEATDRVVLPFEHPLLGVRVGDEPVEWTRHIGLELQPWLADHAVGGAAVVPAAALIEMALAAARARHPAAASLDLIDVEIGRALVIEPHVLRDVRLRVGSAAGDCELSSRPRLSEEPWIVHMSGRIAAGDTAVPVLPETADTDVVRRIEASALYATAAGMGLDYGPAFRTVTKVELLDDDRAVAHLASPTAGVGEGFLLPPNLTDGALQGLLALAAGRLGSDAGVLPWRFGRVRLLRPEGAVPAAARLSVTRVGPRSVKADILLLDDAGIPVAELGECWFVRVNLGRQGRADDPFFHTAQVASAGVAPAMSDAPLAAILGAGPTSDHIDSRLLADAYVAAVAMETLQAMAVDGVTLHPQALIRDGQVSGGSRALFDQLLRWLAADGLAEQRGDGAWTLASGELPTADTILRTLFFDAPAAVAEAALLALAGGSLPTLLRDGPDATPALPPALWDQLLGDSPAGTAAADALLDAIARVADARPDGTPMRVLEVGARRGAFTRRLLRRLPSDAVRIIAATDADDLPTLTDHLRDVPAARAIAWAPGQPIDEPPFDLIVGFHALSLGAAGARELGALHALLVPGGRLLVAEPSPNRVWRLLRPDGNPLADAARWRSLLQGAGFAAAEARSLDTAVWPMDLIGGTAAAATGLQQGASRPVLLFARPEDDFGEALTAALHASACVVTREDIGSLTTSLDRWASAAAKLADSEIVVLPGTGQSALPGQLAAIAALNRVPAGEQPVRVTLLLRAPATGDIDAAALAGVRRVLGNEAPHVACRMVRLDPALTDDAAAMLAAEELGRLDGEQEVAWSSAGRTMARVRRALPVAEAHAPDALRLTIQRPGLLDSLGWTGSVPAEPGSGEVAIGVEAAGLNFRDVMWAMGLLPDEALLDGFAGPTLGLECAGTVTAVGPDVTAFAPGDRVMAFAPASLGTHTVTAAHAVMRMPAELDFAAAATVPVAFLTVAYALGHLARVGAGETVLVHGGAGGVGLAAIQYAKARGATVFATAGSPAKRALLRSLGVDAVLDSRSIAFADEVMRLTDGHGVDVVLNSLSGEAMRRSLALVRPFGRFLELGKRDFYENSAVGLRPFRHNVSYFGIDADQLPLRRPALASALFDEIAEGFAAGTFRPLPHRAFDYADAEDAFRLMQASGHIGKIVLRPGARLPAALSSPAPFVADATGSYVVTGGLDGFGFEAARWLAAHGARQLALLGRRGPATPGADARLAELAAAGADARAYAVDVADETALAAALATIREGQAPIAGVVHAAVAMDDALLSQLDADRFARALRPKLAGAEALDRLTRDDPVSLFLLFSSVTTPLGNPGQGNYVAANAAIEALAERRHAEGLPALAVQWGPIGDAGYLSREAQVSDMLARQLGGSHLTAAEALDTLPALLASGAAVVGMAPVKWGPLKGRLPLLASPLFAEIGGAATEEAAEVDLAALLEQCSPEEAHARVTALLVEEVARIMKLAPDRVEAQRPLAEFGMDSLMAVELRLAVEERFGITIPLLALSEGATLTAMAGRIVRGLGDAGAPQQADEASQLVHRLTQFEGSDVAGPADGASAPSAPGFAAAAVTSP